MLQTALMTLVCAQGALSLGVGDSTEYDPVWAGAPTTRTITLDYDVGQTSEQNGAAFKLAVAGLIPGDTLVVGSGSYSVNSLFSISVQGTAAAPIRIVAASGAQPVITRPNAGQNVINIGRPQSGVSRFVLLRGFEITGGSIGMRIQDARDLWIDRCHIHHTGAAALRASSENTERLTITRCEIDHPSQVNGTGEGMYLGANFAVVTTRDSVVALNHVHHTLNAQGDGIELKQGSSGCVIAENIVHDTNFPGILCYGTGGGARNVIRGNVIYRTEANAMQVQGDALVENNVVFAGEKHAFVSFDHQDQVGNLEVIGNTFLTNGADALRVQHWSNRPGMVLANNALYSENGYGLHSLDFSFSGVTVANNVVYGDIRDGNLGGHLVGTGLADFTDASFDGSQRDAHPTRTSALLGAGDTTRGSARDQSRATRPTNRSVGALEFGTYGTYGGEALASAAGEPRILFTAAPFGGSSGNPAAPAASAVLLDAAPGQTAVLFFYVAAGQSVSYAVRQITTTGADGTAVVPLDIPTDPALAGLAFETLFVARDPVSPAGLSRTQTVRLSQ